MSPRLVGLVADDVTGATDAAVQFAAVGWPAHLLCSPDAGPNITNGGPSVLAVATGVRAAGDDEAAAGTARAVLDLMNRGCDRLYLKIDSTMRGSVAGQVRGALEAWAQTHHEAIAVLCPAFPQQGRVVTGGVVLVDGVPLGRTAAAADPVTPVFESRLDRLVPGASPAIPADLGCVPGRGRVDPVGGLVFVDASTDADLDDIAAALDRLGPPGVAAGSAGLAAALARRWSEGRSAAALRIQPAARILVGVSSLHPVATESVQRLRHALSARRRHAPLRVDVISTPTPRADTEAITERFGDRMAEQLARARYDALVLVGGDGAAETLARVGASAVAVQSALAPGVPIGTILGGAAHNVCVVTMSGGFGRSDSLVRIIDRLQDGVVIWKEHL